VISSTPPASVPRTGVILLTALIGLAIGAGGMRAWMSRVSTGRSAGERESSHPEHEAGEGDEHGHGEAHEEGHVSLSADAARSHGIEIATAAAGKIERTVTLPGEVRLDADRVAHIVPRVAGMVRDVRKKLGDSVAPGEVIAVLDSRELADAKAADLAAASRHELAQTNVARIERLFEKKIAPEEELLKARQALAETDIDHRTAEAKLHALGLTLEQVESLHTEKNTDYARYEIKAPFAGTVVDKHITLGEVVGPESKCFLLADLANVWIDVTLYPQEMPEVAVGHVVIVSASGVAPQRGEIAYISPRIDETARTGLARVVLANAPLKWRPGMFVKADLVLSADEARVVVPESAIQSIENETVVFIAEQEAFVKRPVVVGRRSGDRCEIVSGLEPGDRYASAGTYILKAELGKAEAEHEH